VVTVLVQVLEAVEAWVMSQLVVVSRVLVVLAVPVGLLPSMVA
jgi:hypothetical protein